MYALPTAVHVLRLDQVRVVPDERDGRGLAGDHLVDLAPTPDALVALEQRGLVHRLVDLRIVELRQVVVAAVRTMFEPLNVGSSIDCGSLKSLNQPADPQTATFLLRPLAPLGVDRVLRHRAEPDLEAELLELGLGDLGLGLARVDVRATRAARRCRRTCPRSSRPSSCTSRPRPCRRAGSSGSRSPGPFMPPASSKPAMPGGMKCVGDVADELAAARLAGRRRGRTRRGSPCGR